MSDSELITHADGSTTIQAADPNAPINALRERDSWIKADLDPDIVRALHWCRLGRTRPHDEGAFHRAKRMGLLAQDSVWRTTEQGDGVLIALGYLEGKPAPRRTRRVVLWVTSGRHEPEMIASWSTYQDEQEGRELRAKAEEEWRFEFPDSEAIAYGGHAWRFFTTHEYLNVPEVPGPDDEDDE